MHHQEGDALLDDVHLDSARSEGYEKCVACVEHGVKSESEKNGVIDVDYHDMNVAKDFDFEFDLDHVWAVFGFGFGGDRSVAFGFACDTSVEFDFDSNSLACFDEKGLTDWNFDDMVNASDGRENSFHVEVVVSDRNFDDEEVGHRDCSGLQKAEILTVCESVSNSSCPMGDHPWMAAYDDQESGQLSDLRAGNFRGVRDNHWAWGGDGADADHIAEIVIYSLSHFEAYSDNFAVQQKKVND